MAHEGVVVQVHLTIHGDDLFIAGLEEGVDLEHAAIQPYVGVVQVSDKFYAILKSFSAEAQVKGDLPGLEGLEPSAGMDPFLKYPVRGIVGDFFNVHSSL